MRWVAILSVIFIHSLNDALGAGVSTGTIVTLDCVDLFFVISGAVLLPLDRPVGAWLRRRMWRVVPAFVVWSLIYLIYYAATERPSGALLWEWLYSLPVRPTWPGGWFILVLIGLYAFAPVISGWLQGASRRAVEWYLIIWMASGCLPYLQLWAPVDWVNGTVAGQFYGCMGYMLAGYYLMRWPWRTWTLRRQIWVWAVLLILFVVVGGKFTEFTGRYGLQEVLRIDCCINTQAKCLLLFMLMQGFTGWKGFDRFLAWSGRRTYGLYLCSWLAMTVVATPLTAQLTDVWAVILNFAITLGLSYAFVALVGLLPKSINKYLI